jgi:predicted  nucleic acid-binding Zn-ribbon protein
MPISEAEDNDRIEAIEQWMKFNRDPSDEHWRNIETLLHRLHQLEQDIEDERDEMRAELEHALGEAESRYEDRIAELEQEVSWLEADLEAGKQRELAERRRADGVEKILRRVAERLGPKWVASVEKLMAKIDGQKAA